MRSTQWCPIACRRNGTARIRNQLAHSKGHIGLWPHSSTMLPALTLVSPRKIHCKRDVLGSCKSAPGRN
jgi:hypothetical protein